MIRASVSFRRAFGSEPQWGLESYSAIQFGGERLCIQMAAHLGSFAPPPVSANVRRVQPGPAFVNEPVSPAVHIIGQQCCPIEANISYLPGNGKGYATFPPRSGRAAYRQPAECTVNACRFQDGAQLNAR
jgi:hypothetical protein